MMSRPWHVPGLSAVTLPAATSADGLPLGVPLLGRRHADDDLLEVAAFAEALLPAPTRPW